MDANSANPGVVHELDSSLNVGKDAAPGRYTVAVKIIDIFGNDTVTLVSVTVG